MTLGFIGADTKKRDERGIQVKQPEGVRIAVKSNHLCEHGFKNLALIARGGSCSTVSAVVVGLKQENGV